VFAPGEREREHGKGARVSRPLDVVFSVLNDPEPAHAPLTVALHPCIDEILKSTEYNTRSSRSSTVSSRACTLWCFRARMASALPAGRVSAPPPTMDARHVAGKSVAASATRLRTTCRDCAELARAELRAL
jgi:hypothetical protein